MLEAAGNHRYWIKFPPVVGHKFSQSEAYFYLVEEGREEKFRFHDYERIYDRPGLYEQIFYERLKCTSPEKVGEILSSALQTEGENSSELRVLDLGAGNGMMGEVLKGYGIARLIGVDIIEEAKAGADRDRPGIYDEYYVADFTNLEDGVNFWSDLSDNFFTPNEFPPCDVNITAVEIMGKTADDAAQ